jgi:hypothetical protein
MKKFIQSIAIFAATFLFAGSVSAQNIHFVEGPVKTDNGTTLTVCGKVAGLGNNQGVDITVTTTATISTQCTNPAGKVVPGQSRTETITWTKKFWSDKNGNVSFCLSSADQKPGICPNGNWTGRVTDVSFVNTTVKVNGKVIN